VACERLVVESFGFFGLGFFCGAFEFVDDFPFYFYEVFGVAAMLLFLTYTPSIYRVNLWFCHGVHALCVIRMPVMVPAKPVIAAKTSLFHDCKSAK